MRALPAADTASRASGSGRQMARRLVAEARCRAPQQEIYRPAVRGCPADIHRQKKAPTFRSRLSCLRYLLSQLGQLSFAVKKHAGGERCERCQRQIQRAERVAAVDKIEDQHKPEDFIGHRNRDVLGKEKEPSRSLTLLCLRYLFSQPVTRQLSSAYVCLTSVFGMGTGGPTRQSTQTHCWKRFSPSYIQPIYVDFCY